MKRHRRGGDSRLARWLDTARHRADLRDGAEGRLLPDAVKRRHPGFGTYLARTRSREQSDCEISWSNLICGTGAVLAGTANVIMQLSQPEIGYGVIESRVESGRITQHPFKRARTTFTYLAIALMGTEQERKIYRHAVNRAHVEVRSTDTSPVPYNAFDPALQLWVAACLYWGAVDIVTRFRGPMSEARADALYEAAKPLGTTLQVTPQTWPMDREAFARYWEAGIGRIRIDPDVRQYLDDLAKLQFMPWPIRAAFGRVNLFLTTGFLPAPFRDAMRYEWGARDERRFERVVRLVIASSRLLPGTLHRAPFNWCLWDFRIRARLGRRLV